MNYINFLKQIEDYYGKYSTDMKKTLVMAYLKSNVQEGELTGLWQSILLKHSDVYKTPPGIYEFEGILNSEDRLEIQALKIWNDLTDKVNSYKGMVFEDRRIQASLELMGGWLWFCQRDLKGEVWNKKEFVKHFIYFTRNPPDDRQKIMQGFNTDDKYITYGDVDTKQIKGVYDGENKIKKLVSTDTGRALLEVEG